MITDQHLMIEGVQLLREAVIEYFCEHLEDKHFALQTLQLLHHTEETETLLMAIERDLLDRRICPNCYAAYLSRNVFKGSLHCDRCDNNF